MLFQHLFYVFPSFSFIFLQQDLVVGVESQKIFAKGGMVLDEHAHAPGKAKLGLPCLQEHIFFHQVLDTNYNYLIEHVEIGIYKPIDLHDLREELLCQEAQHAYL